MTTTRKLAAALAATALAAGLVACGEDSGDGASAGPGLSREELGKRADAICKRIQGQTAKVQAPADLTDSEVALEYYDRVLPLVDEQLNDLASLTPGGQAKEDWAQFMTLQAQSRNILRELRADARAGRDPTENELIIKVGPTADAATEAAKKLGASSCT